MDFCFGFWICGGCFLSSHSQSTSSTSSTFQGETKTQNWQEEEKETDDKLLQRCTAVLK